MDYSLISVRYAKAFFLLCQEKGLTKNAYTDMLLLADQCTNTELFKEILDSPIISTVNKKKAFQSFFQKYIHENTLNFLFTIIENKREQMLPSIIRNYIEYYKEGSGLKSATLYTAKTLDDTYINSFKKLLEKELNSPIELKVKLKEQLIGGFVLMVDGKMMDASISNKLNELKNKLLV